MSIRTNIKTPTCQTFVCGQKIDDAVMNALSDSAVSAMYRGETVVNQTGIRPPDRTQALLNGYWEGDNIVFPSKEVGWDYENAGYDKWIAIINFKYLSTSAGVNRIVITHTDKAGATSSLWDTSVTTPTTGSQQRAVITGTFSNPPTGGSTERESIGITVYTAETSTVAYGNLSYGSWTGVINFNFKLYTEC